MQQPSARLRRIKSVSYTVELLALIFWITTVIAFAFERIYMEHLAVSTIVFVLLQFVISRVSVWACESEEKEIENES